MTYNGRQPGEFMVAQEARVALIAERIASGFNKDGTPMDPAEYSNLLYEWERTRRVKISAKLVKKPESKATPVPTL
jgi:hypothetical protein